MKKKIASSKKLVRRPPALKAPALKKDKPQSEESWLMRLYVAGQSTRSVAAISNLRRICDRHMPGRCTIEVIDLMRNPELAKADQICRNPHVG